MKGKIFWVIVFIFIGIEISNAINEAEKIWEQAEKLYNAGKYKDAIVYYEKSLSLCSGDNECISANLNGIGTCYEALGDDMKALSYYEKALTYSRNGSNKDILATSLFNTGAVYYRQAIDYQKAYNNLDESCRYFRELGDKNSLGICLHYLGKVSSILGRYEKAMSSFDESYRIEREKSDKQAMGANLANIGRLHYRLGEYDKANSYYEDALKIAKELKNYQDISVILRDLGDLNSALFKNEKAISYYEEAIEIQRRNNLTGELAISYNNLGAFYADLNEYEKAIKNYTEALKLAKNSNDIPTTATLLNNIGHVYAKLGDSSKALNYYLESLELEKKLKRPQSMSYVLNNLGMEYFKLEKYDSALKYLKEALDIDKKLNNPHFLEIRLNNIGAVYLRQGKLKEAESVFLERKRLEDRIKPNRLLHSGLVEVYLKTGRFNEALRLVNEIKPNWRDNKNRHVEYYTQVGLALKGKGDLDGAINNLKKAIEIIEDMRHSISDKGLFFAGGGYYSRLTPYKAMISVLAEMSERNIDFNLLSSCFFYAELTKARTLLEAMAGSAKKVQTAEIPSDIKAREEELLKELIYIDSKWEESLKKGEKAIKEWQAKREKIKKQLDELIHLLRKNYPRYAALYYPLPVHAEELPLKENEVLLEYAVTDEATYLFIVRKGGVNKLIKISVDREALEDAVKSFIEPMNLKKPESFSTKDAKRLYDLLLSKGLKGVNENDRIIIIPDGILGLLPFEALVIKEGRDLRENVYVANRYTVTYYQSATILALNRILKQPEPEKLLFAIGNPVYSSDDPRYTAWKQGRKEIQFANLNNYALRGLAVKAKWGAVTENEQSGRIEFLPLPETEDEVKEIARIMEVKPEPPQILLSVMANETNVRKSGLEKYKYLHFATHASLPGMIQGINEPFILLGQVENQGDDGFLTLSEVTGIRLNADMVVLSACVTGVGKEVEGEGVVNFARAFQQVGARAVVVSLWEVASKPAVEYMKLFYGHIKSGKSRAEAMKLARAEIKAKYPSPFYWAVFILHGEG